MRRDLWMPSALLGTSLCLWYLASNFRSGFGRYEVVGPAFFPKILLAGIAVTSLWQLGIVLRERWRHEQTIRPERRLFWGDFVLAVAITVGYTLALHYVGFIVASLIFQVLLLAAVFRERRWGMMLGVPACLTTLFFLIFIQLMGTPLPRGKGVFHTLSRLIY